MNKKTDKVTKFIGALRKSSRKSKKFPQKKLDAKRILGPITISSQDSEL
jgi:hypothetical protein